MSSYFSHLTLSIIILLVGAFISLIIWLYKKNKNITFDTATLFMILSLSVVLSYLDFKSADFFNLSFSTLNNFLSLFIIFLSTLILYTHRELINEKIKFGEYILLYIFSVISSLILISSDNLLTIFVTLELLSISLYILTGFDKKDSSLEASVKYLITGSIATVFFIISLILIKYSQGSVDLKSIITQDKSFALSAAGVFFISGVFFKIAVVPMHSWSVDVYCGSPNYITTILVSFIKFSVIVAGYRIFSSFSTHIPDEIIIISSLLTMLVPGISALTVKNIKKIAVYSSISHVGFIIMAFAVHSNPYLYFYILVYSLTAAGLFTIINLIEHRIKNLEYQNIKELWQTDPEIVIMLFIFLFSLAGVPPFAGFFAKFYVFYSAINSSYTLLAVAGSIISAISVYYYIKILIPIFYESKSEIDTAKILPLMKKKTFTFSVMTFLALSVIFLGVFSGYIISLLERII